MMCLCVCLCALNAAFSAAPALPTHVCFFLVYQRTSRLTTRVHCTTGSDAHWNWGRRADVRQLAPWQLAPLLLLSVSQCVSESFSFLGSAAVRVWLGNGLAERRDRHSSKGQRPSSFAVAVSSSSFPHQACVCVSTFKTTLPRRLSLPRLFLRFLIDSEHYFPSTHTLNDTCEVRPLLLLPSPPPDFRFFFPPNLILWTDTHISFTPVFFLFQEVAQRNKNTRTKTQEYCRQRTHIHTHPQTEVVFRSLLFF